MKRGVGDRFKENTQTFLKHKTCREELGRETAERSTNYGPALPRPVSHREGGLRPVFCEPGHKEQPGEYWQRGNITQF